MRLRVLLVEDNALNLRLAADVLELRGHEVVPATSVAEAKPLLMAPLPDVVLLDIQLPGEDGHALLRHVRESEALSHLCVVAVTASAMQGDRERALAAGFDGYLTKPIDVRTFAEAVEDHVRRKARRGVR